MDVLAGWWEALQGHKWLAAWLGGVSLLVLAGTAAVLPAVLARIPQGYFRRDRRARAHLTGGHPLLRAIFLVLKNLLGAVLVVAGLAMLVLPGQGLISILAGLMLMNFPGKHALERWLIRRPGILAAVNWLRARHGAPPLDHPDGPLRRTRQGRA